MSPGWGSLGHHVRVSGLTALAGWVTVLSWHVLSEDFGEVAFPLLFLGALIAVGGAVARWRRLPITAVVALQVLAIVLVVVGATTGSLPTITAWGEFTEAIRNGIDSAQAFSAPVPANAAPVHPLLLIGGALVLLAVDLCAGSLRRVSTAGLPLLAAYSLPVAVTAQSVSWWVFLVAGALFLAALFAQHNDQLAHWGRSADDESSAFSVRTGAVANTGAALGATALAIALVVPLGIPTLSASVFDGPGPGTRSVTVEDPMVDLRRDLQRGEDIPLLWVSTPGPTPTYLRMAVLTSFANGRWTPGDREIPEQQIASGELPGLDGVSIDVPRITERYQVRISADLESTWLPTLAQVTRIEAGSDWRYDLATRDFIAARDDVTTAQRSYDFTGVTLDYDAQSMNDAVSGAAAVRSVFTEVPPSLSNEVRRLAASVTADAPTRYQKAQVLQQWFREDGGFRYDVRAVESVGDDGADLLAFLDEDGRVGYCEQFAASMAIMARVLGIPARVAVGFLQPRNAGVNTWEFSAWDLHAWPELYFPGSGWVRFEPTPSDRAQDVPGYTTAEFAPAPESPTPSAGRSSELLPERGQEDDAATATEEPRGVLGISWSTILVSLLLVLALVGVLLLPRMVRRARRRSRLAGGVEEVWDELRDQAVDLGHGWPVGRSPRRTGAALGHLLARPVPPRERPDRPRRGRDQAPEAAAALDRLVERLERSRYSREADSLADDALTADAELVATSLAAGVSAKKARRAEWWPRSVVRGPRRGSRGGNTTGSAAKTTEAPIDELVG